jgi:hypothetical protein
MNKLKRRKLIVKDERGWIKFKAKLGNKPKRREN